MTCTATPKIIRLNASIMKQTYATPAQVGTNVRSVTQSRFGATAVNSRFTGSGCRAEVGSGRVVFTRFDRIASLDTYRPHKPARLVPTDLAPGAPSRLPELPDPIDAVIVFPDSDKLRDQDSVANRPR